MLFLRDPSILDSQKVLTYERVISILQKDGKDYCSNIKGYCRRPETRHVNCDAALRGDKEYLSTVTGLNRIPVVPNSYLNMSCAQISDRVLPKYNMNPLKLGGIAFARNVFTDYEFIEKQIQMTWHPDNRYCFVVDKLADKDFIENMKQLVGCFDDQMVMMPVEIHMTSAGHNQNLAHSQCMQALLQYPNWGYLLLLQNYDIITKTVYELDRVFDLLDGANDMQIKKENLYFRVKGLKWDPISLKLFRNTSGIPDHVLQTPLITSSGGVEATLSREAVRWLIETVDLTVSIDQRNQSNYGGDEQFISTFHINHQLGMPGHFTTECMDYAPIPQITKQTVWGTPRSLRCRTMTHRHGTCLYGIEDLQPMAELPYLLWNKVYPQFDQAVVDCTAELIYNRTFLGQVDHELEEDYYSNLVTVKYHKDHKKPGFLLNCKPTQKLRSYEDYL
ncbi:hypothetical protein CRE_15880 [Caenorhabditis remanei]|uniref:Uncharacterized protein n=1 Tax=Caenorhabditis remanei TaxID=31234 RepID=E3MBB0_CAERE|nr:hypothetical protein CRE_15880 [Caenorhabditis remanei]